MEHIYLHSATNNILTVSREAIGYSKYLQNLLSIQPLDENGQTHLHLNIPTHILIHIVNFMEHYIMEPFEEIPPPLTQNLQNILKPKWYYNFIFIQLNGTFDSKLLMECMEHANYLIIEPLVTLCGMAIANLLRGKTVEEMRDILGIKGNFEAEQEKNLKQNMNSLCNAMC